MIALVEEQTEEERTKSGGKEKTFHECENKILTCPLIFDPSFLNWHQKFF